jgi:hypothetical protein
MTVRFTPDDLLTFDQVAWPRISAGLWSHIARHNCHDGDQVLVYFRNMDLPVFRFELDRSGIYSLWFRSASSRDWYSIATGTSAAQCLSIWGCNGRASE